MTFRFRRSIRLFSGLHINVGKRGFSTSIGTRGAHVTVGHDRILETVGIPGSGMSWTESQSTRQTAADVPGAARAQDGPEHGSLLGRIVRVVLWGILGAWVLSIAIIWLIARFWPGP